jgi:hypothetical protein
MKYIKKFESVNKKFWIISPNYPYNYILFRKIGMEPDIIKDWIEMFAPPSAFDDENEILLFNDWSWSSLTAKDSDGVPYLSNPDYENMGKIILDQDEIDAYKTAYKFNL